MRRIPILAHGALLALGLPVLMLPMLISIAGCGSSKTGTDAAASAETTRLLQRIGPVDPDLDALIPSVFANLRADSTYYIGFAAGAGGASQSPKLTALHGISALSAVIYGPQRIRVDGADASSQQDIVRIDSLWSNNVSFSGTMRSDDGDMSITGTGGVVWHPATRPAPGTFAIVTVYGAKGVVNRRVDIVPAALAAGGGDATGGHRLQMWLDSRQLGRSVEIVLHVKRLAAALEGEYQPSGERFRIEIRNDLNETIWSSSTGKVFTQALMPVEPINVGQETEYRAIWSGYNEIEHAPAAAGTYRVVATIPATPAPYVLREELTLSGW